MVIGDSAFALLIVICMLVHAEMGENKTAVTTSSPATFTTVAMSTMTMNASTMTMNASLTTNAMSTIYTTTTTPTSVGGVPEAKIIFLYVLQGIGRACFEGLFMDV